MAKCGSITDAANCLGLSVPATSRRISTLENELGVRLFNRTTRKLSLTEEGRLFLQGVTEALDKLGAADRYLKDRQKNVSGTIKALLPTTFCKNYVMPELPGFLERYPDIDVQLQIEDYAVDLLDGGFDVAVQFGAPSGKSYISRRIGSAYVALFASPEYLDRRGVPATIEDLEQHDRICFGLSRSGVWSWNLVRVIGNNASKAAAYHLPQGRVTIVGQLDSIIQACLNGLGITPMDIGAAMPYLRSGALKLVLPDHELSGAGDLYLLYPQREHLPQRVRVFIDFLIEASQKRLRPTEFDPYAFAG